MVYSNIEINQAIKNKHIVCVPFEPKHISQASLDVTLGEYFYATEKLEVRTVYNPFDQADVERYFDGPHQAIPHEEWCEKYGQKLFKGIPLQHPIIVLRPQERILAHTHEFVGIRPPGACEIRSRSSWGRNGVAIAFDAGWIDPGYINRITLEVFNLNKAESVVLPVGERVGQLIFHQTGEVDGSYGEGRDKGFSGKYQSGSDLDEIIRTWKPQDMIPRAYKDKRQEVLPL
ncbi:MAG TPA: deoxycytidine triphosphate deaminase [Candidatus Saccharimonadales bacterium]